MSRALSRKDPVSRGAWERISKNQLDQVRAPLRHLPVEILHKFESETQNKPLRFLHLENTVEQK